MGAYGPMTAAAGAGGAAAYYAGQSTNDGSHYYESVPAENAYGGMGSMGHDNGYSQSAHDDPYGAGSGGHGYGGGAPQLNWAPGASPPLDHDVYAAHAAQGQGQGGANVFADPSSSSNETDGRIDMTAHEAGSAVSLRDDQDYGRRLAVRND